MFVKNNLTERKKTVLKKCRILRRLESYALLNKELHDNYLGSDFEIFFCGVGLYYIRFYCVMAKYLLNFFV